MRFSLADILERMGLSVRNPAAREEIDPAEGDGGDQQEDDTSSRNNWRKDSGKVVKMPGTRPDSGGYTHESIIYVLRSCDDCQDVIDDLLWMRSVMLNIEDLPPNEIQRTIDMLSGAAYAAEANLYKISKSTYCLAPKSVKVMKYVQKPKDSRSGRSSVFRDAEPRDSQY